MLSAILSKSVRCFVNIYVCDERSPDKKSDKFLPQNVHFNFTISREQNDVLTLNRR